MMKNYNVIIYNKEQSIPKKIDMVSELDWRKVIKITHEKTSMMEAGEDDKDLKAF